MKKLLIKLFEYIPFPIGFTISILYLKDASARYVLEAKMRTRLFM